MIFQKCRRNDIVVSMTEFRDLQNVRIKWNNLDALATEWDACLLGMLNEPSSEIKRVCSLIRYDNASTSSRLSRSM